jgi:hypothetical protein
VNGSLRLGARNGSLYLVTGVDKCRNWGAASYSDSTGQAGFPLRFTAVDAATFRGTSQYSWESSNSVEARTCPALSEDISMNQCVFVRGYKLALRENLYKRSFVGQVKVSDIVSSAPGDVLAKGRTIPGAATRAGWFSRLFGRGDGVPKPSVEEADLSVESYPKVPDVRFRTHFTSFYSDSFEKPYHPSSIIIPYLFESVRLSIPINVLQLIAS